MERLMLVMGAAAMEDPNGAAARLATPVVPDVIWSIVGNMQKLPVCFWLES